MYGCRSGTVYIYTFFTWLYEKMNLLCYKCYAVLRALYKFDRYQLSLTLSSISLTRFKRQFDFIATVIRRKLLNFIWYKVC